MKKCKEYVSDSGKCKLKVPHRYNDYCDKKDCPKSKKTRKQVSHV